MRGKHLFLVLALALSGGALNGVAQRLAPPALNPTRYVSPSGEFACDVDPSDLYGRGEGNYQITRKGVPVWQGKKPFTLYEVAVTDNGMVAGYAYTHGIEGFSRDRRKKGAGELHVVIMRSNGELVLDKISTRSESRVLHEDPDPVVEHFAVDAARDLLVLQIFDSRLGDEKPLLRGYRLSNGREVKGADANSNIFAVARSAPTKPVAGRTNSLDRSAFADRPLKQLGTFSLQGPGSAVSPAIRDVICFDFDDHARIGFIRQESPRGFTFVHLSPEGNLLREIALTIPAAALTNDTPKMAWLERDRWVISASDCGPGGKASAWWLNAATGEFKEISGFASPPIWNICGSRDGGFVARTITHLQYSMEDAIIAFDKAGKVKWRIRQDYSAGDSALFSPEDVTVTTGGKVAVLDNIRHTVQLFGDRGNFETVLKLEKIWGRQPSYPSEITADNNGGILIKDFNGHPPVVRMNATGKIIGQFQPKHPNGRVIDAVRGIRVAPSGRVWVCDGECFIRVSDEGVADLALGNPPKDETLGKIAAVTVDQRSRLYAVDERTGAVHVFDANGHRLYVCKPETSDFSGKLVMPDICATSTGDVYLSEGNASSRRIRFIHFAPDGRRLGPKEFPVDTIKQELYSLPENGQSCLIGYHDVFLLDRDGKTVRTIQRRPDRKWLEYPQKASVAPDGSFAIVTGQYYAQQPWQVNLYSKTGEAVRTMEMPADCNGYVFTDTGRHLVTSAGSEICLFTKTGEPFLKFLAQLDGLEDANWQSFATDGGRELWLVSAEHKSVRRFALPE